MVSYSPSPLSTTSLKQKKKKQEKKNQDPTRIVKTRKLQPELKERFCQEKGRIEE